MRKANAIIEYSVLIFIVVAAIAGLHFTLKRHFQGFIRAEADTHIRQSMPFTWQGSLRFSRQSATQDRYEEMGGDTVITSDLNAPTVALSPPPPPVAFGAAGLHSQDAASAPPGQSNPKHQAETDTRKISPKR